jgi:hypothetical protein
MKIHLITLEKIKKGAPQERLSNQSDEGLNSCCYLSSISAMADMAAVGSTSYIAGNE